jgi:hypothetical protein
MKRILLAGLLSAGAAFGAYAQSDPGTMKLSAAECASLWNQASPDGGPISESQAAAYVTDFKTANPDGDTTLEKAEFTKACDAGLVKSAASSGAGTGEAGSAARNTGDTPHPPTNRMDKEVPAMTPESGNQ